MLQAFLARLRAMNAVIRRAVTPTPKPCPIEVLSCRLAAVFGGPPDVWMTRQPIHLVRTAAAELAAVEGRQVLRTVDAVALGTGSYKPRDARTLRDS